MRTSKRRWWKRDSRSASPPAGRPVLLAPCLRSEIRAELHAFEAPGRIVGLHALDHQGQQVRRLRRPGHDSAEQVGGPERRADRPPDAGVLRILEECEQRGSGGLSEGADALQRAGCRRLQVGVSIAQCLGEQRSGCPGMVPESAKRHGDGSAQVRVSIAQVSRQGKGGRCSALAHPGQGRGRRGGSFVGIVQERDQVVDGRVGGRADRAERQRRDATGTRVLGAQHLAQARHGRSRLRTDLPQGFGSQHRCRAVGSSQQGQQQLQAQLRTNDYMNVSDDNSLDVGPDFTMSLWFSPGRDPCRLEALRSRTG